MKDEIKEYIDKQKSPQREILNEVARIIMTNLPGCRGKKGWGAVILAGGKFYFAAANDHVKIGFAITGLSQEEADLFQGKGKTMRHVKISSLEDIDAKKLAEMIKLVNKKAVCVPC